jgi:hypothetical protein
VKTALVAALLLSAAEGAPTLRLRVDKPIAFFPEPVELSVSVLPNTTSRLIHVEAEFALTSWTIERVPGAEIRPERRTFRWKVPAPGEYVIAAVVLDAEHRIQASKSVTIRRVAIE